MASIAKRVVALGANVASFEADMERAVVISKREMRRMEKQAQQLGKLWAAMFIESEIRKR